MKVALVQWTDAHPEEVLWATPDDFTSEPFIQCTVGYLVEPAKPRHVTIAQTVDIHGRLDHVIHVPVAMVVDCNVIAELPPV